jgi:ADP-heptose:LPS heptosyltransferase
MEYRNLYEKTDDADNIRKTMYKEDTNVLSYYVITNILMYNYQSFLHWCKIHNTSLLQFKKTTANQLSFCDFIEKKYKTPKILHAIDCSNDFFRKIKTKGKNKSKTKTSPLKKEDFDFITNNLRMTICELG